MKNEEKKVTLAIEIVKSNFIGIDTPVTTPKNANAHDACFKNNR